ncbi:hypothetical protein BGZ98_001403 [Dissophora globulifera]|nr:hypothetical protein BGZ98_001403 [Dissophora globulifera]
MVDTQSFRLAGTTEIQKIPTHYVDGQSVVYWESIEHAFPGAKQVKNGNAVIPHCIKSFPGVVLDVVSSSAIKHLGLDSSVEAPSVIPTVALAPALTVGLTETPADLPNDLPTSEDIIVEAPRVTSTLTETPINDDPAHALSTGSLILSPTSISKVKATSKTALSFKQIVLLASKSANLVHMIKFQNAFDAKQENFDAQQEKTNQLLNQVLEQQEEMNRLQKQSREGQEEVSRLQRQVLEEQEKMDRLQKQALEEQEKMNRLQIQSQEESRQMRDEVIHHQEEMIQL